MHQMIASLRTRRTIDRKIISDKDAEKLDALFLFSSDDVHLEKDSEISSTNF